LVGTNSTNREGAKYITELYKHLLSNDVFQKPDHLQNQVIEDEMELGEAIQQLNKMDAMLTSALIQIAKQTCQKKDAVLWTPEIRQTNLRVQYLNIMTNTQTKEV
jgi:hypothetical protein